MSPTPNVSEDITKLRFTPRRFASMFRLHVVSRQIATGDVPQSPSPEMDTAGVVLKVVEAGEQNRLYLTDESGLVLRVEREGKVRDSDPLKLVSQYPVENLEKPTSIALHDIRMMPFDPVEGVAVAVFANTSTIVNRESRRLNELERCTKKAGVVASFVCLEADVPRIPFSVTGCCGIRIAFGYIAGYQFQLSQEKDFILIGVDCGVGTLHIWRLPFCLIDEALTLVGDGANRVSLRPEVLSEYAILKVLKRIVAARGVLLRFVLEPFDDTYEVRQLKLVRPEALARVYTTMAKK